jgi:hypothetical protein
LNADENARSWNGASALHAALGQTCVTHANVKRPLRVSRYLVMRVSGTIRPARVRNVEDDSEGTRVVAANEHDPGRNATHASIADDRNAATPASAARRATRRFLLVVTSLIVDGY